MSMSAPGGRHGGRDEEPVFFHEINVTPLTDVFLVLLVIFMVTATGMSTGALDVALPKAVTPASVEQSDAVIVSVDAALRFSIAKGIVPAERLEGEMKKALASSKDGAVILAGDREVPLDKVVLVMEAARRAGAKRFAIAVAREGEGAQAPAPAARGGAGGPGGAGASAGEVTGIATGKLQETR